MSIITHQHNSPGDTHYLTLRGVNYRAEVYADGSKLSPLPDPADADAVPTDPVGMFHRWTFKLPPVTAPSPNGSDGTTISLAVLIHPPDYPGNVTCPINSTEPCGQGGDHLIAMNAATQQSAAGWDWIQGTPDRNTGIWDKVFVTSTQTPVSVLMRDPYLRTLSVHCKGEAETNGEGDTAAVLEANAVVTNAGEAVAVVVVSVTLTDPSANGKVVGTVESESTKIDPGTQVSLTLPTLSLAHGVKLWWPHTHGEPFLYDVRYDLLYLPAWAASPVLVHSISAMHGIRTIATHVDMATMGRVFEVNG